MSLTFVGSIVSPVGWLFAASIVQLPSDRPVSVYLNTLSAELPSSTTQNDVPSVTIPVGLASAELRRKLLTAPWLPDRRDAAPAYLNTWSLLVLLVSTQTSVPLVATPSTEALRGRSRAAHDPSRPPVVVP